MLQQAHLPRQGSHGQYDMRRNFDAEDSRSHLALQPVPRFAMLGHPAALWAQSPIGVRHRTVYRSHLAARRALRWVLRWASQIAAQIIGMAYVALRAPNSHSQAAAVGRFF